MRWLLAGDKEDVTVLSRKYQGLDCKWISMRTPQTHVNNRCGEALIPVQSSHQKSHFNTGSKDSFSHQNLKHFGRHTKSITLTSQKQHHASAVEFVKARNAKRSSWIARDSFHITAFLDYMWAIWKPALIVIGYHLPVL